MWQPRCQGHRCGGGFTLHVYLLFHQHLLSSLTGHSYLKIKCFFLFSCSARSIQTDVTRCLLVFSPAVWIRGIFAQPSSLPLLTWWAETSVCPHESWEPLGWICSDDGAIPRLPSHARPYDWISRHGWGTVCVCGVCACLAVRNCVCGGVCVCLLCASVSLSDLKVKTLTLIISLLFLVCFVLPFFQC